MLADRGASSLPAERKVGKFTNGGIVFVNFLEPDNEGVARGNDAAVMELPSAVIGIVSDAQDWFTANHDVSRG